MKKLRVSFLATFVSLTEWSVISPPRLKPLSWPASKRRATRGGARRNRAREIQTTAACDSNSPLRHRYFEGGRLNWITVTWWYLIKTSLSLRASRVATSGLGRLAVATLGCALVIDWYRLCQASRITCQSYDPSQRSPAIKDSRVTQMHLSRWNRFVHLY